MKNKYLMESSVRKNRILSTTINLTTHIPSAFKQKQYLQKVVLGLVLDTPRHIGK